MIIITDSGGETHEFKGDELTSAEQQAILFLHEQDKKNEVF